MLCEPRIRGWFVAQIARSRDVRGNLFQDKYVCNERCRRAVRGDRVRDQELARWPREEDVWRLEE